MVRRGALIALRSIFAGWAALGLLGYLIERPLLLWTGPLLGDWTATVGLTLDCGVLTGVGWIVGRLNRENPIFGVLIFAATLTVRDLTPWLPVNVPWLFHLAVDAFHDDRYVDSLLTTAAGQALLFGCLIGGGLLARPRAPEPRIDLSVPGRN